MSIYQIASLDVQEAIMTTKHIKANQTDKETELIQQCMNGERLAQSELYKRWYNQVFAVCVRYASDRDESKNLVNTTFFKVFRNLQSFQSNGAFGAWVRRIAINTCLDHVRASNKIVYMESDDLPETYIENDIISRLSAEDILTCLHKVSPISRVVFSLNVIDGYKHQEIAEKLNIKEATSRWHLLNAKKELRELLKNY